MVLFLGLGEEAAPPRLESLKNAVRDTTALVQAQARRGPCDALRHYGGKQLELFSLGTRALEVRTYFSKDHATLPFQFGACPAKVTELKKKLFMWPFSL